MKFWNCRGCPFFRKGDGALARRDHGGGEVGPREETVEVERLVHQECIEERIVHFPVPESSSKDQIFRKCREAEFRCFSVSRCLSTGVTSFLLN